MKRTLVAITLVLLGAAPLVAQAQSQSNKLPDYARMPRPKTQEQPQPPTETAEDQIRQQIDALRETIDQDRQNIKKTQKDMDEKMWGPDGAAQAMLRATTPQPFVPSAANRPAGCPAVTSRIIAAMPALPPGSFYHGQARLRTSEADEKALLTCVAQGDGASVMLLTMQSASDQKGTVGDLWLMDAMLLAGELGELRGFEQASVLLRRSVEDEDFAKRAFSPYRIQRFLALTDRYHLNQAVFRDIMKIHEERAAISRSLPQECREVQRSVGALKPQQRQELHANMSPAAARLLETCIDMGIDLFSFETRQTIRWADGLEKMQIVSGGRRYTATDIATLYDDWQEAQRIPDSNWNYSHPKFIKFADDDGIQYLAGFDPYIKQHGDETELVFRVLSIDGDRILAYSRAVNTTVLRLQPNATLPERERARGIRLGALGPAFNFMVGHYRQDGRPAEAVVNAISAYQYLDNVMLFHEVSKMLKDELAKGG